MKDRSSRFVWQQDDLQVIAKPYLIDAHSRSVRTWATFRPPFEPERDTPAWHFRRDLREAVSKLRRSGDEILRCAYASSVADLVDAENVLVYNLGPNYLAPAASLGVRFVRTFTEPPPPPSASAGMAHYLEYGFTQSDSQDEPIQGAPLASWRDVPWPDAKAFPRISELWFALRASRPDVHGQLDGVTKPFCVTIEIGAEPGKANLHPIHVLKPLLDAVISAFHRATDTNDNVVTRLVAEQARTGDIGRVEAFLRDERFNVLGSRAVVGRYREGLKWNPADERCVLAQVLLKQRAGAPTFSGQLVAVA